ncbi:hypothetical protein H632_c607p0 [Helicosporidium sp. ATCC 50920]|nr:hypothetical protein H632_c607p0 [Helicosporidium sp. ATCC 50920]|eukprot:KDD75582.1 hypothetical protein H632_c607p0 [Helicosporidium sp. ATCC 50920]
MGESRGWGKRSGDDKGGGRPTKRKYYLPFTGGKRDGIPLGCRGVLVSCLGGKEQVAAREAIAMFSQLFEEMRDDSTVLNEAKKGAKQAEEAEEAGPPSEDVDEALQAELDELRNTKAQPFYFHSTGIKSTVFVEMQYRGHPGPVELTVAASEQALARGKAGTRLCNRFYPIEHTCFASLDKIGSAARRFLEPVFGPAPPAKKADEEESKGGEEENKGGECDAAAAEAAPQTNVEVLPGKAVQKALEGREPSGEIRFAVQYEHRAAPSLDRMAVIDAVVDAVRRPPHKVDLTTPQVTVLVNVLKGTAGLALVPRYKELKKFNLRLLAAPEEGQEKEKEDKVSNGDAGVVEEASQEKE